MNSTMSLRLFSPEVDDVSKLMEDEMRYDNFVDNIGQARRFEADQNLLNEYRIGPDPMNYINLDSENASLN